MPFKPVDTAIRVLIGPAIDDSDFKVREETIAFGAGGMEVDVVMEKADGTVTTTAVTPTESGAGVYDWVHTDQGYYTLELPASGGGDYNNTEEGILTVVVYVTGVLPMRSASYDVIPVKVYNSLVKGSDNLEVDQVELLGTAVAAASGYQKISSGTGTGQISLSSGRANADVVYIGGAALSTSTAQLGVNVVNLGGSAVQAASGYQKISAGTGTGQVSLSSGLVTVGTNNDKTGYGLADGAITAAKFAADAIAAAAIATNAFTSDAFATSCLTQANIVIENTEAADAADVTSTFWEMAKAFFRSGIGCSKIDHGNTRGTMRVWNDAADAALLEYATTETAGVQTRGAVDDA